MCESAVVDELTEFTICGRTDRGRLDSVENSCMLCDGYVFPKYVLLSY